MKALGYIFAGVYFGFGIKALFGGGVDKTIYIGACLISTLTFIDCASRFDKKKEE